MPRPDPDDAPSAQRLQKVLAAAGHGSRRDCEELILAGRVEVDRRVVTELGTRVNPATQDVRVDGEALRHPKRLYFAVNKPPGVVTTNHDPSGRARVIDLVPTDERVFAVGRLDRASEGLILVTNDGEFANRLTHPRYGVEKTYLVRVAGAPDQKQLDRLRKGVHFAEGFARVDSVTVKKQQGKSTDMTIVLSEGRNREIRRILARVGHKVLALKRIAVGIVKLADLPSGGCRKLTPEEVQGLLALAKHKRRTAKSGAAGKGTRDAKQGTGDRRQEPDDRYVQKAALLAQPLSLEDLLRDDLDEGPLTAADFPATGGSPDPTGESFTGAVIDDQADFSPPPRATRPRGSKQPARGSQPRQARAASGKQSQNRRRRDDRPRESFGEKRGEKRGKKLGRKLGKTSGEKREGQSRFDQPREDRSAAAGRPGKSRFGAKSKKPRVKLEGTDNQRRGKRRGAKKSGQAQGKKRFGKHGGKRKGRR